MAPGSSTADAPPAGFAGSTATGTTDAYGGGGWVPPPSAYVAAPQPQPVPPRSRRRRLFWGLLLLLLVLFVIVPALVIGAVVIGIAKGEINFTGDLHAVRWTPDEVEDFPVVIHREEAELVIDLTELDDGDLVDLAALDGPAEVRADLTFGEIRVIVPDDLDVAVDADVTLGEVVVFDESENGINPGVHVQDDDSLIELDLEVELGSIVIERD
jgi:hypothetical protein